MAPNDYTHPTALYPPTLRLEQAHLFFRHGERAPSAIRFTNAGLPVEWPLCSVARQFAAESTTRFRLPPHPVESGRNLNGLGIPVMGHCALSELTDRGYLSTLQLGQYFRDLYINKLHLLPERLNNPDLICLRTSKLQRTYTTLRNVVTGLYPPNYRDVETETLKLDMRDAKMETLLPNEDFCPRLIELFGKFSQVAAKKWDESPEVTYLNGLLQKYMPNQEPISVLSKPKIHGIFDTISTVLATPNPESYLPREFFDPKARRILENIAADEEYMGFTESNEFRMLGIGDLLREVVERMRNLTRAPTIHSSSSHEKTHSAQNQRPVGDDENRTGMERTSPPLLALFACHDSTLAGIMTSLGVMKAPNWTWPGYASFLAIELFSQGQQQPKTSTVSGWRSLLLEQSENTAVKPSPEYFIRLSFNGRPLSIPACQPKGNHLDRDGTFCDLNTFVKTVEKFTPKDWKSACVSNLGKPVLLDGGNSLE